MNLFEKKNFILLLTIAVAIAIFLVFIIPSASRSPSTTVVGKEAMQENSEMDNVNGGFEDVESVPNQVSY